MSEVIPEEILETVEKAKAKGTFNILDVLKERAYPKDEVAIYLDEQTAYDAAIIKDEIDELSKSIDPAAQDKIDALVEKRLKLVEALEAGKYIFTISGISEGKREDIIAESEELYPVEYEDNSNIFKADKEKIAIPSKDREKVFANKLWAASIEKITAPDGSEQGVLSEAGIEELRRALPIAALTVINNSIEKLRIATAMFMLTVDEDFLAKS